jgi:pyruvate dehydrogenase E1 component beta subunit
MKAAWEKDSNSVPTAYAEYFESGEVSVRGALNLVLYQEFERDDTTVLIGEEVAEYNGAYKISKGLWKKHGADRVIDTPITEMGFTGMGVGAALNGLRPIIEFMSFNFSMQAIDQIVNSAGKLLYMSGGRINVPICFRGCNGGAKSVAAQHSQDFSSWYSSVPGLKVFAIYDHIDAVECFRTCIRDEDPCVQLENEIMYGAKFPVDESFFTSDDTASIEKIRVMREGTDITLISHSRFMQYVLEAADILEKEDGVSVEVLNNRCLRPMDRESIIKSVKKTHRIVYCEEGWPQCGIGAEVAATLMESEAFDYLDAPFERVCGIDVPTPYCPNLEEMVLPSTQDIVNCARRALRGRSAK